VFVPAWSVVNATAGSINGSTGLFTAGTVSGTYTNTVQATSSSGISGFATVVVAVGPLASITVTPTPDTLSEGGRQTFTAVGKDANGNIVVIVPVWSVVNAMAGSIDGGSGLFIAGTVPNQYLNTVQAKSSGISGFATVVVLAPPVSPLGAAAPYGIISGAAINCATPGNPGHVSGLSSPANLGSGNATINGFPPCTLDGIKIVDPAVIAAGMADLVKAYLAAQNLTGCTVLDGTDLGGLNLAPGCYSFSTSAALTGNLTLTGSATDTWTFQIGSTLTTAVGSKVILAGGAIPDNVYWAVGTSATLGTDSEFSGNIMALSAITLNGNAILSGRALAQTAAVDMIVGGSRIIKP